MIRMPKRDYYLATEKSAVRPGSISMKMKHACIEPRIRGSISWIADIRWIRLSRLSEDIELLSSVKYHITLGREGCLVECPLLLPTQGLSQQPFRSLQISRSSQDSISIEIWNSTDVSQASINNRLEISLKL